MVKMPIAYASFPGWHLIKTEVVAAGGVTSIDFTNLSINVNDQYMLIFHARENASANQTISLYVGGDTTDANYTTTKIAPVLNVMTQSNTNNSQIITLPADAEAHSIIFIDFNGSPRAQGSTGADWGAALQREDFVWLYISEDIIWPVTTLTLTASNALGLGLGTYAYLFKKI